MPSPAPAARSAELLGTLTRRTGRLGGSRGTPTTLLLTAVVLTAFNLRTAVNSVGPVLDEVRTDIGMSGTVAGLLTSVPVLSFAAVGSFAPLLARRMGASRALALAMALMGAGVLLRAVASSTAIFLACSVLALVGGAIGNVLLPMLVKQHFPDRVGLLTAAYTTSLAAGMTLAAALTVPTANAAATAGWVDDPASAWRVGVAVWALPALVAAAAWLAVLRRPSPPVGAAGDDTVPVHAARSRLGWALAVYFGAQSLQAYVAVGWFAQYFREAGASAEKAGYVLAVYSACAIPISMAIPAYAARLRSQRPLVVVLGGCYAVGYTGMLVAPIGGAWLWALLVGAGAGAFPLALTLIGLRSATARETASLSAFTQGTGYVLAATGPLLVGWLHDRGGWDGPFVVLFVVLALQLVAGLYAGSPAHRVAGDEGSDPPRSAAGERPGASGVSG